MRTRHISTRLLALLVVVCLGVVVQLARAGETAHSNQGSAHSTSLVQLGYPAGLLLAENTLPQRYSLLFSLPATMEPEEGVLRLHYRAVPPFVSDGALVVTINDQRVEQIKLAPDGAAHEWIVPLTMAELEAGQLKVAVESAPPGADTRCRKGRLQPLRVRLLATSALQTRYRGEPKTLRDFWLSLPEEVSLSLPPGELNEGLFATALEWVAMLQRQHHTVHIVRLPELGEVVLAPRSVMSPTLETQRMVGQQTEFLLSAEENVGLVRNGDRITMVITDPYPEAQQFAYEWQTLDATALLTTTTGSEHKRAEASVALTSFDMDSSEARFAGKMLWTGTITPWKLPQGSRPVATYLKMKVPKALNGETRRIFVHLNDRLAASQRIDEAEEVYQLNIPFRELRASNIYNMNITVSNAPGESCIKPAGSDLIGIDVVSQLLVENDDRKAMEIAALPTAYGHGFDLILPLQSRSEAELALPMLGALLNSVTVAPADYSLLFYRNGEALYPERNFLFVGAVLPEEVAVPLRLDKGRVEVVDRQGRVQLDDEQLRKGMVLQMARYGEKSGMWAFPGEQSALAGINVGLMESSNVVFYSENNELVAIDTRQRGVGHIRYLDAPHWFERLYMERQQWLLGGWILLTLAMLYFYVIPRRQRDLK